MIRILIILLLIINVLMGLYGVYRHKLVQNLQTAISEEKSRQNLLMRTYDQLKGEYNYSRGNSEDEMIARNRLGMRSPKGEQRLIAIGKTPVLPSTFSKLSPRQPW